MSGHHAMKQNKSVVCVIAVVWTA